MAKRTVKNTYRTTVLLDKANKEQLDKLKKLGVSTSNIFRAGIKAYWDQVNSKDFRRFLEKLGITEI